MTCDLLAVWHEALTSYDFGPGHPLAPVRLRLTIELARALGVFDTPGVEVVSAEPASDELLLTVHQPGYVAAVRRAGTGGREEPGHGFGPGDNPVFRGMHEASARIVGASVAAATAVWRGDARHAVNIAGGLHHAMPDAASGFCVYNDPAVAIAALLARGARRVAYVDTDVHHGDGVQHAFYDDPRVLTISLHERGDTLFPGTGWPTETGGRDAEGYAVNVALPAGTDDDGWLRAFDAIVPPLLRAFAPEILVSQHGCDGHALDPLANLLLSVDGLRASYQAVHRLAHEITDGRWILFGGGGYELVRVVPRAWTHLLAEASGRPLAAATSTPGPWRDEARQRTGEVPPLSMTDGRDPNPRPFDRGYDPADPVDRAIIETREAVFPAHGLIPLP